MPRIKKDDVVKIIAGKDKGVTGKVERVNVKLGTVLIEGIGVSHRHVKPSQFNPQGGKKDIHTAVDVSKVALVIDEKSGKTSRVGYKVNSDGAKVRFAKSTKKEVK